MSETLEFLKFSRDLLHRHIVPFSFTAEDFEDSSLIYLNMEAFLFDSELSESICIPNSPVTARPHYLDYIVYSEELIYRPRKKLQRFFMNFIKDLEVKIGYEKPAKTHIRAYSMPVYDAERLVNMHSFSHLLNVALKKAFFF